MRGVRGRDREHIITVGHKAGSRRLRTAGGTLGQLSGNAAPLCGWKDDATAAVTVGEEKKEKKARISFLALHVSVDAEVDRWLEGAGAEYALLGLRVVLLLVLLVLVLLPVP